MDDTRARDLPAARREHTTPARGTSAHELPAWSSEILRWPVGIAVVAWRYLWQTVPMHRSEEPGDDSDLPATVPLRGERIQDVTAGYGPLLHRRYAVTIVGADVDAAGLMRRLVADPNRWVPSGIAVFRRASGWDGAMAVGDEFLVRLPGPWNGPVRVVDTGPCSFRLATLSGHLEAGQIEFRTEDVGSGDGGEGPVFVIESWARPGGRLSHLLYNRLLLAKEIQLVMWTRSCLGAAAVAGGRARDGIEVRTRRVEM